jgi:hypothetical protein
VERYHILRFLNHGMTGFAAHFEEEWPNRILAMDFAYRISVTESTLCTPALLCHLWPQPEINARKQNG